MKSMMFGIGALVLVGIAVPMPAQDVPEKDRQETLDDEVARIVEQLGSKSQTLREKAERRLDELDKDALDALKEQLDVVKRDGNVDLELKLRAAIKRLESPANVIPEDPEMNEDGTGKNARNKGRKQKGIQQDEVLTPEDILKKFLGGKGIESIETGSETDGGEKARTITQVRGEKTITLKYDEESGKINAEIKDAATGKVENLEFIDEVDMAEKRPELHDLWVGKRKPSGSLFGPAGENNDAAGHDALKQLQEQAGDKVNQGCKAQEPEDRRQDKEQKDPPQEQSRKQPKNAEADPKENKPQREEDFWSLWANVVASD